MKIVILTPDTDLFKEFNADNTDNTEFSFFTGIDELRNGKELRGLSMGYIDLDLLENRSDHLNNIRTLEAVADIPWGILDFKKKIKDPVSLILNGWWDYLGGKKLPDMLNDSRLRNVLYYSKNKKPLPVNKISSCKGIPSGLDWSEVVEDNEYLFGMLYLEAIPSADLESRLDEKSIIGLQSEWQRQITNFVDPWYGHLWINNGWSSIVLFPFNGKNLLALECAIEFWLNQPAFTYPSNTGRMNYKQVIHLDTTQYKLKKNTSKIVSESLNDLFHMGLYHAAENRLYISETAAEFLPESLKQKYLEKPEVFEGKNIYCFKKCR